MCLHLCVSKVEGSVCVCRLGGGGWVDGAIVIWMNVQVCVHCCISVKCVLSRDICVCVCVCVSLCGVYLPLVVFSAHVERSGLSVLTPSHSTSEMHILSDSERQRKRRSRRERSKGRKGQ